MSEQPPVCACEDGFAASDAVNDQARTIESLLPELMRNLFVHDGRQALADLPYAQLRVVRLLEKGPIAIHELAATLRVTASSVSQVADRLEAAGLVKRIEPCDDRRSRELVLTPRGATLFANWRAQRVRAIEEIIESLDASTRQRTIHALEVLNRAAKGRNSVPDGGASEG